MTSMCLLFLTVCISVTLTHQRSIKEWDQLDSERDAFYPNSHSLFRIADEMDSSCQCDWRLLRQYEAKGCRPMDHDDCGCPLKFDCPEVNEIEEPKLGCHFNENFYPVGAMVTNNSCESCQCTKISTRQVQIRCTRPKCPNLRLEPGCHLEHNNEVGCCPYRKVCGQPESTEDGTEEEKSKCHYKGKVYDVGETVNTSNSCEICQCAKIPNYPAQVNCTSIQCPKIPLEPGCFFVVNDNGCCPVTILCDAPPTEDDSENEKQSLPDSVEDDEDEENSRDITCIREGREYPLGARMYSELDPCEVCICTKDWSESNNSSCYQQECIVEKYKAKLLDLCVPIYREGACCAIEFYCSPDIVATSEEEKKSMATDSMCVFGGKYYEIGKSLSINQGKRCTTCTCQDPPELSCLQKLCPRNPNKENCEPYFTSDSCCPKYDCLFGDDNVPANNTSEEFAERELEDDDGTDYPDATISENPCFDINCTEGSSCMLYQVMCGNASCSPAPTCLMTNSSCPTPMCDTGCVVTEQDEHRCPTCVCGEEIEKRAASFTRCSTPRCFGENCYFVAGENGCPVCSCDQSCPTPRCPAGCNVLSVVEGRCPQCICEDENVGCPTPICEHDGCHIANNEYGCPTCICDRARSGSSSPNRELEHEESRPAVQTTNIQFPQQQDSIPSDGVSLENSQSQDDYDEIAVIRRSTQTETKDNMEVSPEMEKSEESMDEERIQSKNISPAANGLNVTPNKDEKREP